MSGSADHRLVPIESQSRRSPPWLSFLVRHPLQMPVISAMRIGPWLLVLWSFQAAALGQGQFAFNNRVPPDINAKFQLNTDAGTTSSLVDSRYTVLLLGGPHGNPCAKLSPLATTNFRTGVAAG